METALIRELLGLLNKKPFSYYGLKEFARACEHASRSPTVKPQESIALFVLARRSFDAADTQESSEGSVELNRAIESSVKPALLEGVESLLSGSPSVSALHRLISMTL